MEIKTKKTLVEEFVIGAKKGFYISVEMIMPAMVLAYALIQFLKITGLMPIIGQVCAPLMMLFGLPGEAVVALIAAFFAKAAGAATAASLYGQGVITAAQATFLFPATITMGTLIGHFVRIVIVANANVRWHKLLLAVPIIDAIISLWIAKTLISVLGVG